VARTRIRDSIGLARIRRRLRVAYRDVVFRRAMRRFLKDPAACTTPGNRVVMDLIYGWANEQWSALDEFLVGCIDHALTAPGPILECGSGLSTILVGAIAKRRGQCHWALAHQPEWAAKVKTCLDRYKIDSVVLHTQPLKSHGEFSWYDVPLESMPDGFGLVVCDGPPLGTPGGRYGLVPIMRERLKPGCVILLDDAQRTEERAIAQRWEIELGVSLKSVGLLRPYIEMTLNRTEDGAAV